ncbi:DgyrCDS5810 [Dimorphilus gyrociliatus]|uniref:DgyrCDS5810 n=1 Tax=Dimorphilus gyrociliatus TaxID=2664684 RepID=A0A7I8VNV1_9ANNE|nr:DgyrCDS5810 [Dimorphilus gyrociliatus]
MNKNENNNKINKPYKEQDILVINVPKDGDVETIKLAIGKANEIYKGLVKSSSNSKLTKIVVNVEDEKSSTKVDCTDRKLETTDFRDSLRNSCTTLGPDVSKDKKSEELFGVKEGENDEKSINSMHSSEDPLNSSIPIHCCLISHNLTSNDSDGIKSSSSDDCIARNETFANATIDDPFIHYLQCYTGDKISSKSCSSLPNKFMGKIVDKQDLTPSQLSILYKMKPKRKHSDHSLSTEIEFIEYSFEYTPVESMTLKSNSKDTLYNYNNKTSIVEFVNSKSSSKMTVNKTTDDKIASLVQSSKSDIKSSSKLLVNDKSDPLVLNTHIAVQESQPSSKENLTITNYIFNEVVREAKYCVETPKDEESSPPIFGERTIKQPELKDEDTLSNIFDNSQRIPNMQMNNHHVSFNNCLQATSDTALINKTNKNLISSTSLSISKIITENTTPTSSDIKVNKIMELELRSYEHWVQEVFPNLSSIVGDLHKVQPEYCKNWNNCRIIIRQLLFNIAFIFAANEEISFLLDFEFSARKDETTPLRRAIYGQMKSIFHSIKKRIAELELELSSDLKSTIFSVRRPDCVNKMKKCCYYLIKYALLKNHPRGYEFMVIFASINFSLLSKLQETDRKYQLRFNLIKLFSGRQFDEKDLDVDYSAAFSDCLEVNDSEYLSFLKRILYKGSSTNNRAAGSSKGDSPTADLTIETETQYKSSIYLFFFQLPSVIEGLLF